MSRKGNMRCFAMFPKGTNITNTLYPMHRRSSASREDFELNYVDENVVFAPPIMKEICTASMFNDDVKCFKEVFVKEIKILLHCHKENQEDIFCVAPFVVKLFV